MLDGLRGDAAHDNRDPSVVRNDADQRARTRKAILRHLRKNPLAADTVAGILAYWLPHTGFEDAPEYIGAVLEDLVAERRLQARPLPDGNVLYACGDTFDDKACTAAARPRGADHNA